MKKLLFWLLTYALSAFDALSQAQFVSVNNSSGTAIVNIPLGEAVHGKVRIPARATYAATGVRVKQVEGTAGIGWNFNFGGAITRTLRGLPDDFLPPSYQADHTRRGWYYSSLGTVVDSFIPANTGSGSCTNEANDISYINSNIPGYPDTEPDVFNVSAPGLSFQLILDKDHNFHTIPYQDVKVVFDFDTDPYSSTYNGINSFTITDNKGFKYVFSARQIEYRLATSYYPGDIIYNKRAYEQYKEYVIFTNSWMLTSITDDGGNAVSISYHGVGASRNSSPVEYIVGSSSVKLFQYKMTSSFVNLVPQNVWVDADGLLTSIGSFTYTSHPYNGMPMIQSCSLNGRGTGFDYSQVYYEKSSNDLYLRYFLNSLNSSGQGNRLNLQFTYKGNNSPMPGRTILPDSTGQQIDYWGYYSGSTNTSLLPRVYVNASNPNLERYRNLDPGSSATSYDLSYGFAGVNRPANPSAVDVGSLTKINSYLEGNASVNFEYESNVYLDQTSYVNTEGAGIRIKKIKLHDGISIANDITTEYNYDDPSTGNTSGKALSVPVHQFTTVNLGGGTTAQTWQNSIVRSEEDLSQEDHSVIYSHVKVSKTGAGYTRYEYYTPATNWDTSVPDWSPTVVNIGRSSCTSFGYVRNDINTYPFPPNTNYDFERGLPKSETSYNESNVKVSQVDYAYQRTNATTTKISGLRFENLASASVKAYAKYNLYVDQGKVISQQTVTNFDMADASRQRQITTSYQYGSPNHKQPTSISTTSNGVTQASHIKYVKDYNLSSVNSSSSNNAKALKGLYDNNVNLPVESYQEVTRSTGSKIVSASLTKFDVFTHAYLPTLYLPSQQYRLMNPNGVAAFSNSTVTSGNFNSDNRYILVSNYNNYSPTGLLLSGDDANHHVKSKIIDAAWLTTLLEIDNAKNTEVAYGGVDAYVPGQGFNGTGATLTTGRTSFFSYSLAANSNMTCSLAKNPLTSKNVFSIWIKSASSGTLTITTSDGSSSFNASIAYSNTAGQWKYYQTKVQVPASSTFTVQYQNSTAIDVDDALCYPDVAEVTTYDYDYYLRLIAKTKNDLGESYEYDSYGRIKYVYNQDKDIVLKKSYINFERNSQFQTPGFTYSPTSNIYTTTPVTFTASGGPVYLTTDGLKVTWNYGDGSPVTNNSTHTFTTAGTYTVTMTMSSPFYGDYTAQATLSVTVEPPPFCPTCPPIEL